MYKKRNHDIFQENQEPGRWNNNQIERFHMRIANLIQQDIPFLMQRKSFVSYILIRDQWSTQKLERYGKGLHIGKTDFEDLRCISWGEIKGCTSQHLNNCSQKKTKLNWKQLDGFRQTKVMIPSSNLQLSCCLQAHSDIVGVLRGHCRLQPNLSLLSIDLNSVGNGLVPLPLPLDQMLRVYNQQ